jgi:hypothetical protein
VKTENVDLKREMGQLKEEVQEVEEAIMNPSSEAFKALVRRMEAYLNDMLKGWEKNIPGTELKEKKRTE